MPRNSDISNSDDIIDSRDVIARIEEMKIEISDAEESAEAGDVDDLAERKAELAALQAFAKEGENYAGDWHHGAQLIRESYFTAYCEEMVSDIGDMPREIPSYIVIDWQATADNLRVDYTEVDFDGVTYLVR